MATEIVASLDWPLQRQWHQTHSADRLESFITTKSVIVYTLFKLSCVVVDFTATHRLDTAAANPTGRILVFLNWNIVTQNRVIITKK